jgi:hypothetical protein
MKERAIRTMSSCNAQPLSVEISPTPEVVLVFRFDQPSVLARRLGNLATLWLRTMALAAAITEIWEEELTTIQTFALCASLHWQTATPPPKLKETLPPRSKNHPPSNLKNPRTTRRKKSAVLKLLKKIAATKRGFQTGGFTRFSNRR